MDLIDAIRSAGMLPPEEIIWDGQLRRFPTDASKMHSKDGWLVTLHDQLGKAAVFGSWRTGQTHTWTNGTGRKISDSERRMIDEQKQRAWEQRRQRQMEAEGRAAEVYHEAGHGTGAYLERKGIVCPTGVRRIAGVKASSLGFDSSRVLSGLLVPVADKDGRLRSLQYIPDDPLRIKLFVPDTRVESCFHVLGDASSAPTILVGEGLATAQSAHEATGYPAVVAFSAHNLLPVAQIFRARLPNARIVILMDEDDAGRNASQGAAKAVKGHIATPGNGHNDFNDLHRAVGLGAVKLAIEDALGQCANAPLPSRKALAIAADELANARLAPACVVTDYLFADVAQLVAPGGTGKTTLLLYEAIHIVLGRPLWGLPIETPGWVLYITAEDPREHLVARMRRIMESLKLSQHERETVMNGVLVLDVSGEQKKLIRSDNGNIVLTDLPDQIVATYKDDPPVMVVIDPLVSFGASEGMVNDNEQGMILAARRINRGLGCCVRYVHHTGKANAREATLDQYSGRGGSALADGTRMTAVLQAWTPDGVSAPPTGCTPGENISITKLARAKLSYSPPNQPVIWIRRNGYEFEYFIELPVRSMEESRLASADQVERFLMSELSQGRRYTTRSLEVLYKELHMTRGELRAAVETLRADGRVVEQPLPKTECHGRRQDYLHPSNAPYATAH